MKTAPGTVQEARQMIAQCQRFMWECMPERDKILIYKQKIEFIIDYTEKHLGEKLTVKYLSWLQPIIDELNEGRERFQKRKREMIERRKAGKGGKG